jgi:hypothetical protein
MKFKMILWLLLAASVAFAGWSWAQMNAIKLRPRDGRAEGAVTSTAAKPST